jgi:hypothetical protein
MLAHVRRVVEAKLLTSLDSSIAVSVAIVVPSYCGQRHRLIVQQGLKFFLIINANR